MSEAFSKDKSGVIEAPPDFGAPADLAAAADRDAPGRAFDFAADFDGEADGKRLGQFDAQATAAEVH